MINRNNKSKRVVEMLSSPAFRSMTFVPELKENGEGMCQMCEAEEIDIFDGEETDFCAQCLSLLLSQNSDEENQRVQISPKKR